MGSWSQAAALLAHINHPGSQEDLVSNWEPANSLVEDAVSELRLPLVFWLWLFVCLPLCLRRGEGLVRSQLALFGIRSTLCSLSEPGCMLGQSLLRENSLFFFSLSIPQFGLLSHVSSLRLSSGHSDSVLTLSMQPAPPCPAVDVGVWVTSLLGVVVRRVFCVCVCVCVCVFSPSRLCCPLRFQNSPQTHQ